jgi:hypothetical protein
MDLLLPSQEAGACLSSMLLASQVIFEFKEDILGRNIFIKKKKVLLQITHQGLQEMVLESLQFEALVTGPRLRS